MRHSSMFQSLNWWNRRQRRIIFRMNSPRKRNNSRVSWKSSTDHFHTAQQLLRPLCLISSFELTVHSAFWSFLPRWIFGSISGILPGMPWATQIPTSGLYTFIYFQGPWVFSATNSWLATYFCTVWFTKGKDCFPTLTIPPSKRMEVMRFVV